MKTHLELVALFAMLVGCGGIESTSTESINQKLATSELDDPQTFDDLNDYTTSNCGNLNISSTVSDGIPGPNYYKLLQCFAKKHGSYAGAVDGVPGINTWMGIQRAALAFRRYSGPIDGVPINYYKALQGIGTINGYRGAIDGIPGPNTYKSTAGYFNYLLVSVWDIFG